VGENNHRVFLLYLWSEFFSLLWFSGNSVSEIVAHAGDRDQLAPMALLIFSIMIMFVFMMMTGILGAYHLFLAITNLTTWEHSSWSRITYLQSLKESRGSPFARPTCGENLKVFFQIGGSVDRDPSNSAIIWKLGQQHTVVPNFFRESCDAC